MKLWKLVLILLILVIRSEANPPLRSSESLRTKYPQKMLTAEYGILNEKDILKDWREFEKEPVGMKLREDVWQCFPAREVSFHYQTWKDSDLMGSEKAEFTICDFEFQVRDQKIWSDYWGRRGLPLEFCKSMQARWIELTQHEEFVCLSGFPVDEVRAVVHGRKRVITHWTLNKFQTRKGCFSYFENDCPGDGLEVQ